MAWMVNVHLIHVKFWISWWKHKMSHLSHGSKWLFIGQCIISRNVNRQSLLYISCMLYCCDVACFKTLVE